MIVLYSGTPGFQSAGSREPDPNIFPLSWENGSFNPQARESLIHPNHKLITHPVSFNPQARESLIYV